jgi:hypothetical protein
MRQSLGHAKKNATTIKKKRCGEESLLSSSSKISKNGEHLDYDTYENALRAMEHLSAKDLPQLHRLMAATRPNRMEWIKSKKPLLTQIMAKFPGYTVDSSLVRIETIEISVIPYLFIYISDY